MENFDAQAYLQAHGFNPASTGGGFSAWFKNVANGHYIAVSDLETDTDCLESGQVLIGLYDADMYQVAYWECANDAMPERLEKIEAEHGPHMDDIKTVFDLVQSHSIMWQLPCRAELAEFPIDSHCGIESRKIVEAADALHKLCRDTNPVDYARILEQIEVICFG